MKVEFTIHSEPTSKSRPRFNTYTGKAFTDNKTRMFEDFVSLSYGNNPSFEDKYINIDMKFYFKVPKSYTKKKYKEAIEGKIRPTKKDLDNIAKAVLDGLNTKAFIDDRYIVGLTLEKMYAEENRIDVVIEEAI